MRLQLSATLALAMASGHGAHADSPDKPVANASMRFYADDDHVAVVSPSGFVRTLVSPRVSLAADITVDAVSAASVDVVTSASPSTVEELRIEVGVTGMYRLLDGPTWLGVGLRGSHEKDYDAVRVRLTGRRELAQRNTTVDLSYVLGADFARSAVDETFREPRTSHALMLVMSQLLSAHTVVDVIADATAARGYHASPYRDVLVDQMSSPIALRVSERTPVLRASIATAGRLRHALTLSTYASAMYRYYRDDWSIASHTLSGEVFREHGSRVLLGLLLRGYIQSRASFYRTRYDDAAGTPWLRTHDRTLGAMRSAYVAVTVDVAVDDDEAWHVVGSLGAMRLWFTDFSAQADRDALIMHTGVTTSW